MNDLRRSVFASRTAKMVLREQQNVQNLHRHKPAEFIFALDGAIEIVDENGRILRSSCFLVPPMCSHALANYRGRIARVYLDIGYRRTTAWKDRGIATGLGDQDDLGREIAAFFSSARSAEAAGALMDRWLGAWLDESQVGPPCDHRVATVLAHLDKHHGSARADRRSLAKLVNLSPTRLAAIFAEDTGASLSRYLIWRRVKVALALVCAGRSIAAAAAEAGFSDGAHFTRSCRSTYGCAPSEIVGFAVVEVTHTAFDRPMHEAQNVCLPTAKLPSRR